MRSDGRALCPSCRSPRRVMVVFMDGRREFEACSRCVGRDVEKREPLVPVDQIGKAPT